MATRPVTQKNILERKLHLWCCRLAACVLVFFPFSYSHALNPKSFLSDYAHRSWKVRDGSLPQTPYTIVQTRDGFLWIGTENGLLRFDGVTLTEWPVAPNEGLPSRAIYTLLGSSDGSLWIGTDKGVSRLKDGRFTGYLTGADTDVVSIVEDSKHDIWVVFAREGTRGPLCVIKRETTQCFGGDAAVPNENQWTALFEGDDLWIGTSTSVVRWSPGHAVTYPVRGLETNSHVEGVMALGRDAQGSLLVGTAKAGVGRGLQRLQDGHFSPLILPGFDSSSLQITSLLVDREGSTWLGTSNGIYRIRDSRVDHYSTVDGLSGDSVFGLFQDAEGSLWAVTPSGIDYFHDMPVVSIAPRRDLPSREVDGVSSTHDGTLIVGGVETLSALAPGALEFKAQLAPLNNVQVTTTFEDDQLRRWVGTDNKLNLFKDGHLAPITMQDGQAVGMIKSMAQDAHHTIWAVSLEPRRVLRIDADRHTALEVPGLPAASKLASDSVGGLWLGLTDGDIAYYRDEKLSTYHAKHEGSTSQVFQLSVAPDDSVLASTGFGLFGVKAGRPGQMSVLNGLPCNEVFATIFDLSGNLWMYMRCGLLRIEKAELENWWITPSMQVHSKMYDSWDGARANRAPFGGAAGTPDGRLWFANVDTLQMFDTRGNEATQPSPPVYIEEVTADGHRFSMVDPVRIPPLTHTVTFKYTAPSFSAPQRLLFRYKLEGFDKQWNVVGTRREAIYTQLPPGTYRLLVAASNSEGVWNSPNASVGLVVDPALYQRLWVRVMFVCALIILGWLIFKSRVRAAATRMSVRHAARLAERERVARQIHDTFLQSVQAFLLHLSVVKDQSRLDRSIQPVLDNLFRLSDNVGEEVRSGIEQLRELPSHVTGIAEAISMLGQTLVLPKAIEFSLTTRGKVRPLASDAYENIFAIAQEAIRNAVLHAQARLIEVELRYSRFGLALQVKDDGKGIEARFVKLGREGHWGLRGMRERARVIRGRLRLKTPRGNGTEIILTVPADVAFGIALRRFFLRGGLRGTEGTVDDSRKQ
jgi:signal transduction histidine kinase/ligand-binding sensor domain-containing protein